MATATISQITEALSAAPGDWLEIETAAGVSRSIQKQNLLGALLSGGGTIATGGFTLTLSGNSTLNGSVVGNISGGGTLALGGFTLTVPATGTAVLKTGTPATGTIATWTSANAIGAAAFTITGTGTLALGANTLTVAGASTISGSFVGGGFTLTVPATGVASLLDVAQTDSALKTFSAGLAFGASPQSTLSWYEEGTWSPGLTFGGLSTGMVVNISVGRFTRIGNVVHAWGRLTLTNKGTATGLAVLGGLPYPAANIAALLYPAAFYNNNIAHTDAITGYVSGNTTQIFLYQDAAGVSTQLTEANFQNSSQLGFGVTYRI